MRGKAAFADVCDHIVKHHLPVRCYNSMFMPQKVKPILPNVRSISYEFK